MKKPINLDDIDDDNIVETNSANSDISLGAFNRKTHKFRCVIYKI